MDKRERSARYYKAFDFITGNTYLIGKHESKLGAEAYCKSQGMAVIAQTVVPLTEEEYIEAYWTRKDKGQRDDRIEAMSILLQHKEAVKMERKADRIAERKEKIKRYQHEYYERATKRKRQAKREEKQV